MEAEVQRLKDLLQVAEMQFSEETARRKIDCEELRQVRAKMSYFRKKMSGALETSRDASEREGEMRRQVQLVERESLHFTIIKERR